MLRLLSSIGASNRVVAYTVHEPSEAAGSPVERADGLVFVKDGFNWWAFLLAPIWMLANRMWVVFAGYVAISLAIGGIAAVLDIGLNWAALVNLAINLIVAFEADSLHRWSLDRKGWKMIGTVSGANTRECERRFFERWVACVDEPVKPQGAAVSVDMQA
ncbi:MAG: DUF2628 domain-containing protein [Alphaproteobacteria bacterium]|nr:DUF2628 domain-containing protein [Alphaproteobacteria bacterium]